MELGVEKERRGVGGVGDWEEGGDYECGLGLPAFSSE